MPAAAAYDYTLAKSRLKSKFMVSSLNLSTIYLIVQLFVPPTKNITITSTNINKIEKLVLDNIEDPGPNKYYFDNYQKIINLIKK